MKKFTLISVIAFFCGVAMFSGCKKKDSTAKAKTATEHSHNDGHDHSSHSKDDGHDH